MLPLLPTTIAGSLPKPSWLAEPEKLWAPWKLEGKARYWALKSLELNLDEGDAADEEVLNRILWFSVRGEAPYPGDGK